MSQAVTIIGAGPAGLGAAYAFEKAGFSEWELYEKESVVGGLSRSFLDEDGFTWDIGGHVLFSTHPEFLKMVSELKIPMVHHLRQAFVRKYDRWIPYPIQNNIHRLPKGAMWNCLRDLIGVRENEPFECSDFEEYIDCIFGETLSDVFMRPYNEKIWQTDLDQISHNWISDRIAQPKLRELLRTVLYEVDNDSWGGNMKFSYPLKGGMGSLWQALADTLPKEKIHLNSTMLAPFTTDPANPTILTIPLKDPRLKYTTMYLYGVCLSGLPTEDLVNKTWMYFPDDDVPFYRVTHLSRYSSKNAPGGYHSLLCEVARPGGSSAQPSVGEVLSGLYDAGLFLHNSLEGGVWQHRVEYAYPIPTLDRDEIVNEILLKYEENNIYSVGRFGAWTYEGGNMDSCFLAGVRAAERIMEKK